MLLHVLFWCALQHLVRSQVSCGDSTSSNNPVITLNSTSDVTALSACTDVYGDVYIGQSVSGAVVLDGIKTIHGLFRMTDNPGVTSISSSTLQSVTSWINMINATELQTFSFPQLSSIGGQLYLYELTALQTLQFASTLETGVTETLTAPTYIYNTSLTSIGGGLFATADEQQISITYNAYLTNITLKTVSITDRFGVTGDLRIYGNHHPIAVYLPDLQSVTGEMIIGDLSEFYVPSLTSVNLTLDLINVYFSEFSAPKLEAINGDFLIAGAFTSLSLPALTSVGGNVLINSTGAVDCSPMEQLRANGGIQGSFQCLGAGGTITSQSGSSPTQTASHISINPSSAATQTGAAATSSPTASNSSGGGLSGGAIGGIVAGVVIIAVAVLALAAWFFFKKRRNNKHNEPRPLEKDATTQYTPELPQDNYYERHELGAPAKRVSELRGDHHFATESTPMMPIQRKHGPSSSSDGDVSTLVKSKISGPDTSSWSYHGASELEG